MFGRTALILAARVMFGCGGVTGDGATALDASGSDASEAADVAGRTLVLEASADIAIPTDASEPDAATGGANILEGGGGVPVPLDSGMFADCIPPAGASSDTCAVCEMLEGAIPDQTCDIPSLQCGVGCTLECFCVNGRWSCYAPPCR
jgi:hypothetical protein